MCVENNTREARHLVTHKHTHQHDDEKNISVTLYIFHYKRGKIIYSHQNFEPQQQQHQQQKRKLIESNKIIESKNKDEKKTKVTTSDNRDYICIINS